MPTACPDPPPSVAAAIAALSTELRTQNSATAVLDAACVAAAARRCSPSLPKPVHPTLPIIHTPRIAAYKVPRAPPPDLEMQARNLLRAPLDEPLAYRRVRLACEQRVLSDAHNWYRPSALTASMRKQLATTTTPFGHVVLPLRYTRTHCADRTIWPPTLPPDDADERNSDEIVEPLGQDAPPVSQPFVLEHCATLTAKDASLPFCAVIERYTSDALTFHSGIAISP